MTDFWCGKRVFVSGHTGFKGGWLCLWLHALGAKVTGYALDPSTDPSFFKQTRLYEIMADDIRADVRDFHRLMEEMAGAEPEIVFHLAAQPLVRESYRSPVDTYATNVMGTVHLLEAVRHTPSIRAVINVTTDKCYENREWPWGYREIDPMGGHDPYSSSKGCSELVTSAYYNSFLAVSGIGLASARAGNVIGGGDWSADRLLPDFLRAMDAKEILRVRSSKAVRPWQHVLEPLGGYILLAERLFKDAKSYAGAWNFGPGDDDARDVRWIVNHLTRLKPGFKWQSDDESHPHEAGYLKLDSSKARTHLQWVPRWSLDKALTKVLEWHDAWRAGEDMRRVTLKQIEAYRNSARESEIATL